MNALAWLLLAAWGAPVAALSSVSQSICNNKEYSGAKRKRCEEYMFYCYTEGDELAWSDDDDEGGFAEAKSDSAEFQELYPNGPFSQSTTLCDSIEKMKIGWLDERLSSYAQTDTFIIERNVWPSHDIMTEIARQLLMSLNYKVHVVTCPHLDWRWRRLAEGFVDFNMELWLESEMHVKNKTESLIRTVSDIPRKCAPEKTCPMAIGSVGYRGRSGWYMPVAQTKNAGLDPNRI